MGPAPLIIPLRGTFSHTQSAADSRRHEEEARVGRDGLLKNSQFHGAVVHFDLKRVDLALFLKDFLHRRLVARDEAFDGFLDHGLGKRAHDDDGAEEVLKLFVEVAHEIDC